MARVAFDSIFKVNRDGTIEPKQTTRIGGITITPRISFSKGVGVGGIDLTQFVGHDLEITTDIWSDCNYWHLLKWQTLKGLN